MNNTNKQIDVELSNLESKSELPHFISEEWFSNQLAWLLNPKGSHGFKHLFVKEFLKLIAKNRSSKRSKYKRLETFFKYGKSGKGQTTTSYKLTNVSTVRELFLPKPYKIKEEGNLFADLMILDLDSKDNFVVFIENKLFGVNQAYQLSNYRKRANTKFKKCSVREFVYLTLNGDSPNEYNNADADNKYWVCMSWTKDVLGIINKLKPRGGDAKLRELRSCLKWLDKLKVEKGFRDYSAFNHNLLKSISSCLLEELNRLNKSKGSSWEFIKTKSKAIRMSYSRQPSKVLELKLLSNLSITIQTTKNNKQQTEKLFLPLNVQPDQLFHLLDLFAREIYYLHFKDQVKLYLGRNRKLTTTVSAGKEKLRPKLDVLFMHYSTLRVLNLMRS